MATIPKIFWRQFHGAAVLFGCGCMDVEMASFVPWVHMFLTTSMHTSGVIYSKGSIWLLNLSSLDGVTPLPLANCAIYFDHNPQKSQSQSEFTPVRTLQETVIHGIMGGYYLTCSCFSMFSRHSYSGRNLFPYICPPIYDCFVVICHMHMTASPRIFCVVLWSAAMLTKSPQVPLRDV